MSNAEGDQSARLAADAVARAAGLHRAWAEHRAEVEAAMMSVAKLRGGFVRPADPMTEPVPPYAMPRVGARRVAAR